MKIGIMGGTFDPIHNGHLYIAKEALSEFSLDKVLFIPTGISYMKEGFSKAEDRLAMTGLAVKGEKHFEVSDIEIKRGGNTYTVDTIRELKEANPKDKFYFIIGTDTLFMLEKWRNPEYIFENVTILVAARADEQSDNQKKKAKEYKEKYGAKIKFLSAKEMPVSSTKIRAGFKIPDCNYRIKPDCPEKVAKYAVENNLYRPPMTEDEMLELLKDDLKPKRIIHSFGVRDTAVKLAEIHGYDVDKARIAGLLHDCAKYESLEDKKTLCGRFAYPISEIEISNPELLHAKAGAALAQLKYGIDDPEIIDAIYYHTTGKPNMDPISLIIFISDYIEPGRNHSPKLDDFRAIAEVDLKKCAAFILEETLLYLDSRPGNKIKAIDPATKQSYESYKIYLESENTNED
jgi:nicotinate-nucleotide adenylyltransferase